MGKRRTNFHGVLISYNKVGCGFRHHWTSRLPYLVGYLFNVSLVYPIYFRETVHGEQRENDVEHSSVNHW